MSTSQIITSKGPRRKETDSTSKWKRAAKICIVDINPQRDLLSSSVYMSTRPQFLLELLNSAQRD
ncbi:MAG: hypothetical protein JRN52_11355 [Nitrososphaerota archaeon]|nr:hypothetical protein [Nitrososphaerota archaeon]